MDDAEGPAIEEGATLGSENGPVLAGGSPRRPDDESVRHSLAWWLSFAVPISIALVAIMGAVVGYRAEYHASLSNAFDNDAQVSSTYLSGHDYNALLTAQAAAADHNRWEELARAKGDRTGRSMAVAAEPACAGLAGDAESVAAAGATVNCELAQVFSAFAFPAYWRGGNPATFDSPRFVADWIAFGNLGRDVAVSRHTASADDQRHRELRLLWLGILLALALAFCTTAQAALHHRWTRRPPRMSLLFAVPGWVLLAGCSALVLAWEL
jgi:hypothetical protein